MEHENKPFSVYVKADDQGRIVGVNSDVFLSSLDGWTKIAEGYGDKHHHAQGNFFPLPLTDENGVYRYKLENGQPVERTEAEMAADVQELPPASDPIDLVAEIAALKEKNSQLEEALALLLSGEIEEVADNG